MMLSRLLLALTLFALLVPASLFAGDDTSSANKSWIVIGPNNVIIANHPDETQKLIDDSHERHLLVSCQEYQLKSVRTDGQTHMQLECQDVVVATSDDDDPDGQTVISAGQMDFDSATQTLNLSENIKVQQQCRNGLEISLEGGSLQVKLSDSDIQIEVTGTNLRIQSTRYEPPVIETANRCSSLFFMAPWCGPCQKMQPIINKLRKDGYPIESVNVNGSPERVKQYGISSIPQLVLLEGATVRERVTGIRPFEELKRILGEVESRPTPPPLPEPIETDSAANINALENNVYTYYVAPASRLVRPEYVPIIQTSSRCCVAATPSLDSETVKPQTSCPHCQACQQKIPEPTTTYHPLIPELFNAPAQVSSPKGVFSFGAGQITR